MRNVPLVAILFLLAGCPNADIKDDQVKGPTRDMAVGVLADYLDAIHAKDASKGVNLFILPDDLIATLAADAPKDEKEKRDFVKGFHKILWSELSEASNISEKGFKLFKKHGRWERLDSSDKLTDPQVKKTLDLWHLDYKDAWVFYYDPGIALFKWVKPDLKIIVCNNIGNLKE